VLCQLSYAPERGGLYPSLSGIPSRMTDRELEDMDPEQRRREGEADAELLDEQEGKGYGEDEGEREEALPDE
jgi:hypothetical protein